MKAKTFTEKKIGENRNWNGEKDCVINSFLFHLSFYENYVNNFWHCILSLLHVPPSNNPLIQVKHSFSFRALWRGEGKQEAHSKKSQEVLVKRDWSLGHRARFEFSQASSQLQAGLVYTAASLARCVSQGEKSPLRGLWYLLRSGPLVHLAYMVARFLFSLLRCLSTDFHSDDTSLHFNQPWVSVFLSPHRHLYLLLFVFLVMFAVTGVTGVR